MGLSLKKSSQALEELLRIRNDAAEPESGNHQKKKAGADINIFLEKGPLATWQVKSLGDCE